MVSKSTLRTDSWILIKDIIKNDSLVSGLVNGVYSAYPRKFVDYAEGLPFVVVNKPEITEYPLTLSNTAIYVYTIDFEIHIIVGGENRAAQTLKKIMDAVTQALDSNRNTIASNGLENYTIISEGTDFDFSKGKKIHYGTIRVRYNFNSD